MIRYFLLLLIFVSNTLYAQQKIVNVYAWTGEVPSFAVRAFEKETGIKVNISTYENNEIMYTKLKASANSGYDVVMPTSYFVDRMRKQNMLLALDKSKLPNFKNINPEFVNPSYDPGAKYSAPFLWGVTGMFVNSEYYQPNKFTSWNDFWNPSLKNQLMLLDDYREIFSMALLSLGYPANDQDPGHIKAAYTKLKNIMANVKVFSSETVVSIMIDEDATIGMAWNGDVSKAAAENNRLKFIYPKDGFVIWVDNFAIPAGAPHKDAAYAFINFMLKPEVARDISLFIKFATVNQAAQNLLPASIKNDPTIYPPADVMKRGQFQLDLNEKTLNLYERYWEQLKMLG